MLTSTKTTGAWPFRARPTGVVGQFLLTRQGIRPVARLSTAGHTSFAAPAPDAPVPSRR